MVNASAKKLSQTIPYPILFKMHFNQCADSTARSVAFFTFPQNLSYEGQPTEID